MNETHKILSDELVGLAKNLPVGSIFEFDLQDGRIWIERLCLPRDSRGCGTRFLAEVFCACDRHGLGTHFVADATDEPDDPTTLDLVNWYRRFGAVPCERPEGWPDGWVEMWRSPANGDIDDLLSLYEQARPHGLTLEELDAIRFPSSSSAFQSRP